MADSVVGSLVLQIKADNSSAKAGIAEIQNNFKALNDNISSGSREINSSLKDVSASFEGIQQAAKVASDAIQLGMKGIVGIIGVGLLASVKSAVNQIEELSDIVTKSDKAGISTNLFQIWTSQANTLKITAEEAERAILSAAGKLKGELNPVTGNAGGSLDKDASGIAKFGFTASQQALESARSLDDLHQVALLVVQDYESAAKAAREQGLELRANQFEIDAARVATQYWGEAGVKVAEAIKSGTLNVEEFGRKGQDAAKWPQDLVEGQRNVNEQLRVAYNKLKDELEPQFEAIVRLIQKMESAWAGVITKIADAINGAKRFLGLSEISKEGAQGRSVDQYMSDNGLNFNPFGKYGPQQKTPYGPQMAYGPETQADSSQIPIPTARPKSLDDIKVKVDKIAAGHKEAADSVQSYINKLSKAAEGAAAEAAQWKLGNIDRQKAADLAKAEEIARQQGRTLSEQEKQTISEKSTLYAQSKNRIDQLKEAQSSLNSVMNEFSNAVSNSLENIILKGGKAKDVMAALVQTLSSSALRSLTSGLLEGKGVFGNLLGQQSQNGQMGGLFGSAMNLFSSLPEFATGGSLGSGQWGIAGEAGPELVQRPATMNLFSSLPKFATGGSLGSGQWGITGEAGPELVQGPATMTPLGKAQPANIQIHNYAGANVETQQMSDGQIMVLIKQAIDANNKRVPGIVADAQRRSM